MSERDPVHPWTGELSSADLERLGAEPLRRSDPVAIGPYRVLARLGGGGMGRLYLGREAGVEGEAAAPYGAGALVAVKVIRPEHAEDPRFRRRFEREVEVVRRVHGKYTAGLVASGFDEEERLWMVTAYVPGPSLDDTVRRFGPFPAPVVWRLADEIGEALATLAAAGIVHRDLKPSNVLLGADGARVIDFGVAHTTDASVLTMTGQHVGTPAFMSPEQADGREAGTASDVFSLGSVLAHAATGRTPFGEGSTADVIHRVVYSPPSADVLAKVTESDPALAELIGRCLDKSAEGRPSPQEVVDTARQHAPAQEWPASLAELIGARSAWSGLAAAVSPMEQLTILRRGAPERTLKPAPPKSRRGLVWAAVGTVTAVAIGVVAFAVPGMGSSDDGRKQVAATASKSAHHPRASKSSAAKHSAKPSPSATSAPANPQGGGGGNGGGSDETQPPAEQKQPTRTITKIITATPNQPKQTQPPPKTSQPKPWKSCQYYSGTALTQQGSRGAAVRQVQCILKARKYDIGPHGIDGQFGPDTKAAVIAFQRDHNLHRDGQVGEDTWPALRA
ncbi:putative serine-threonine protein kinase [Streptomyces bingchenggensis BCW-1]|uniref:non-specific serine/threonine protein kinase n=1 Tax=Streptomyces bingchenggensis (strain BCW-1) TaxID=749414 RepID=D7BUW2_STRBB|nr:MULTISPECIES: serine/threonine-protein kinase [Streptomyces]ADI05341.1 putative serine-threonine protein kinase [Streptomyces bingchenggensis BCW-1]